MMRALVLKGLLALCGIATVLGSCDRNYLGRLGNGIISSPGFPFDYTPGQRCRMRIELRHENPLQNPTTHICFSFHRFSLPADVNCTEYLVLNGTRYADNGDVFPADAPRAEGRTSVWQPAFCWISQNTAVFDATFVSDCDTPQRGFFAYFTVSDRPTSLSLSSPCDSRMYTCFNRNCVHPTSLCNGQDDCKDDSDEDYANARCPADDTSLSACNFDVPSHPTCGFSAPALNWRRAQDSPAGPRYDHTLGAGQPNSARGYFMYSSYQATHSMAYLDSNVALEESVSIRCLSFWYFMSGSVGSLSVEIQRDSNGPYVTAWQRTGDHGSQWQQGQLQIPPNHPRIFRVRFQAEKGLNMYSNIGLDDVSITKTTCFESDVTCLFELGLCGWREPSGYHQLTWAIGAGSDLQSTSGADNLFQGPAVDRYGSPSGHYAYVSAPSSSRVRTTALLLTTQMSSGSGGHFCLSFWYHVSGSGFEVFRVKLLDAGYEHVELWSTQSRLPQSAWTSSVLAFNFDGAFQLGFEVSFANEGGVAAIDDAILTQGQCSPLAAVPGPPIDGGGLPLPFACPVNQLICGSGECVLAQQICDGHSHCSDSSDETNCPRRTKSNAVVIVIAIIVILLLVLAIVIVLVLWWRYSSGKPIPCRIPCLDNTTPSVRPINESTEFPSYHNSWDDISMPVSQNHKAPPQQKDNPPSYIAAITGHGALHLTPNHISYHPNAVGPGKDRYAYTNPAAAADDISRDLSTPTPSMSLPSWDSGHMDPAGTVTHSKRRRSLTDEEPAKPMRGPHPHQQPHPGRTNPAFEREDLPPRVAEPRNPPTSTPRRGAPAQPGNERRRIIPNKNDSAPSMGGGGQDQPLWVARLRDKEPPRGPMAGPWNGPANQYPAAPASPGVDTLGRESPRPMNGHRVSFGPGVSSVTQI